MIAFLRAGIVKMSDVKVVVKMAKVQSPAKWDRWLRAEERQLESALVLRADALRAAFAGKSAGARAELEKLLVRAERRCKQRYRRNAKARQKRWLAKHTMRSIDGSLDLAGPVHLDNWAKLIDEDTGKELVSFDRIVDAGFWLYPKWMMQTGKP